jgi:hypothetical protein
MAPPTERERESRQIRKREETVNEESFNPNMNAPISGQTSSTISSQNPTTRNSEI